MEQRESIFQKIVKFISEVLIQIFRLLRFRRKQRSC